MKIMVTPHELMFAGVWNRFCDMRGINIWAVNEGQMDSDEALILSHEEAEKLSFYITREKQVSSS